MLCSLIYIQCTNVLFTCCLLFHTIILRYEEVLPSKSINKFACIDQWSTYATTVDAGYQESIDWIKQNCQSNVDHHHILAGWCLSLSQRFLIMFTKVCDQLCTKLSVNYFDDLLAMIGLDDSDKHALTRCVNHKSPEDDLHGAQDFTLVDMKLTLDCNKMLSMRPIQLIETKLSCHNPTLSTTGKGWNVKDHFNWFDKTLDITKFKGKSLPTFGRKLNNLREAQEGVWINKTLAKVRLDSDNASSRVYSMKCDVSQVLLKEPSLSAGRFKVFFNKPDFVCSHQMIRSLPFDFVKQLKVGKDTNLPREFIKAVRNDASRAETNHIRSIQLWRSIADDFSFKKKEQKLLYYRVEIKAGTSIKTVYLNHQEATFALKFEPWILDTANSLSQVHGYRKITFGDGATLKTENTLRCKSTGTLVPMSRRPPGSNFWYDSDNFSKWCVEGAVTNLLCQLLSTKDASKFKQIAICNVGELITAMNGRSIPKIVLPNTGQLDVVEKCMWILMQRFNCRRGLFLNPEHFKTTEMLVTNLSKISFPVIVSVVGRFSLYNHVVVVWKGMIFDIEHEHPFALTVDSVDSLAGRNNPFHKLVRGIGILPSRAMKKMNRDYSDWGEEKMTGELRHLFEHLHSVFV